MKKPFYMLLVLVVVFFNITIYILDQFCITMNFIQVMGIILPLIGAMLIALKVMSYIANRKDWAW